MTESENTTRRQDVPSAAGHLKVNRTTLSFDLDRVTEDAVGRVVGVFCNSFCFVHVPFEVLTLDLPPTSRDLDINGEQLFTAR